jgi:hypothetical protein
LEERIRPLATVDIFEPLTEQEIAQLDGPLPDRHLEWGQIYYGPGDQTENLVVHIPTPDGQIPVDLIFGPGAFEHHILIAAAQPQNPQYVH